jgi:hypothetical protein
MPVYTCTTVESALSTDVKTGLAGERSPVTKRSGSMRASEVAQTGGPAVYDGEGKAR